MSRKAGVSRFALVILLGLLFVFGTALYAIGGGGPEPPDKKPLGELVEPQIQGTITLTPATEPGMVDVVFIGTCQGPVKLTRKYPITSTQHKTFPQLTEQDIQEYANNLLIVPNASDTMPAGCKSTKGGKDLGVANMSNIKLTGKKITADAVLAFFAAKPGP